MSGKDKHTGAPGPAGAEDAEEPIFGTPDEAFRRAVHAGDIAGAKSALAQGAGVDEIDNATGLAALHMAVGLNDLALARFLVEEGGAAFFPDRFGRWPSLIAAENQVDDEVSDYIVNKEAEYLAAHPKAAP